MISLLISFFLVVIPCSLIGGYKLFGRKYRFHFLVRSKDGDDKFF